MCSSLVSFQTANGFIIIPGNAVVYLDGEASTAQAMEAGERGRVVIGGVLVECWKVGG